MRSTLYGWARLLAVSSLVEWAGCLGRLDTLFACGWLNRVSGASPARLESPGSSIHDVRSRDLMDTNGSHHHGSPRASQDSQDFEQSRPAQLPKVFVQRAGPSNPTRAWATYTAQPSDLSSPARGQFLPDPSMHMRGDRFRVAYDNEPPAPSLPERSNNQAPTTAHERVHGSPVYVSAPNPPPSRRPRRSRSIRALRPLRPVGALIP